MTAAMPARLSRNVSRRPAAGRPSSLTTSAINDPDHEGECRHQDEAVAPADGRGRERERRRRNQRADGADADLQAGERGEAIGREAPGIDGERATSEPAVPSPSSARPRIRTAGCGASANTMAPTTVMAAPDHQAKPRAETVERHAEREFGRRAKMKKNTLDSSPISAGESASSSARLGAMTPIELRRNWLTM